MACCLNGIICHAMNAEHVYDQTFWQAVKAPLSHCQCNMVEQVAMPCNLSRAPSTRQIYRSRSRSMGHQGPRPAPQALPAIASNTPAAPARTPAANWSRPVPLGNATLTSVTQPSGYICCCDLGPAYVEQQECFNNGVSFKDLKKEREMVKWEHMKAMDYLREPSQKSGGKRGGAESRAVVFRGGGGAPGVGPTMDLKSEMSSVTEGIGMELEKRFKEIDTHFQRFNDVDSRLTDVTSMLNNLNDVIKHVTETQEKICKQISELPSCQCNELTDEVVEPVVEGRDTVDQSADATARRRTKLELAVQSALEAAKDILRPPSPPPPPPGPPIPPRESPVEVGLAQAGSEEDSSGADEPGDPTQDEFIAPQVVDENIGRTIERQIKGHRIWRICPFNFEKYPGMRMNVPPEKIAWNLDYPDYFAYDSSEELVLYANDDAHDGGNFQHGMPFNFRELRSIPFNQYDSRVHLRRQSLLGRYRLDPNTGAPLNPMGRTGLLGKGLLPRWGPNHCIVIVLTRWMRDTRSSEPVMRANKHVLQYIVLERNKRFCIPWFLTDHSNKCDLDECVPELIHDLIVQRAKAVCPERRVQRLIRRLAKADTLQVFKGYLDDQLNADSAWLESVVVNIQEGDGRGSLFTDDLLKVMGEPGTQEQVKWLELSHNSNLRTSHNYILKTVAELRNSFY
ncbi:Transient receptor putative cation channel subfamily M member 2 [Cichlidogyrus casuarinus]|uniref:Transient receptor putative cation channel subfamily M member 2 n=1 Tax=Cichlidogyrus casuarinus TaxID=1844966 RepID=A0ABD2Q6U6_9PLAT